MIPCCYSCVLLNDPSLGRALLNPRVWASGRQDELLGGWPQTARSKDAQAGTLRSSTIVSRSFLGVLLLDLLHNTLEIGSAYWDLGLLPRKGLLCSDILGQEA